MYDFFIISSIVVVMLTLFYIRSGITEANQISVLKLKELEDINKKLLQIEISVDNIEFKEIEVLLDDLKYSLSTVKSSLSSVESSVWSIENNLEDRAIADDIELNVKDSSSANLNKSYKKSDVDNYTVLDDDGSVAYILCDTFKMWMPVTEFDTSPYTKNGYKRDSKASIKVMQEIEQESTRLSNVIVQDILDGILSPTSKEAKDALQAIGEDKTNRKQSITVPDGIIAFKERPSVNNLAV